VLVESNRARDPELVPIRYSRMLQSPFAFLRGSALVMALDLAATPNCAIDVQLCGDAHLANFGIFASPGGELFFDINDFDETWPGPFEWDVKRLAASAVVAARTSKMTPEQARFAATESTRAYRQWMERYAAMSHLNVWYSRLDVDDLTRMLARGGKRVAGQAVERTSDREYHKVLSKLTEVVDGVRRIIPDPPLVVPVDGNEAIIGQLPAMIEGYRSTLPPERVELFDHYRLVDMARKVVGVGSVGTLCWILLMQGSNSTPLFLQAKQAMEAAPQIAMGPGASGLASQLHHGERVVRGQLRLPTGSDVLLGWTTAPETNHAYYIRQLWDSKGSIDVAAMGPKVLAGYAAACGWALARGHARVGGSAAIAGYIGRSDRFDSAIADFAEAYADQTERDYAALQRAADTGVITVRQA
jgi:uncharacterized protein (DUF2252 family)